MIVDLNTNKVNIFEPPDLVRPDLASITQINDGDGRARRAVRW